MAKIQIYARVRPTASPFDGLKTSAGSTDLGSTRASDTITINTESKDEPQTKYSRAPGSKLDFRFNHVFGMQATQEEIFDTVAKQMIDTFLDGYNGTIFAYGQTSSGKTHTIEGNGRKFADRGLIPRTLSYIYKEIERRGGEEEMTVHISYMEIYQDTGYDLLNPGMRPGALMVEVPKVQVAEGPGGEVRVRDLSLHLASTEEVAQSLLFQGSTCRKVAETSMNQCSSRSHTIFTIMLTAKSTQSDVDVITRSKLNLVDLAGSERVAKTGADGRILQEAKHINLSLHHLEHVIVTLQQYGKQIAMLSNSSSTTGSPNRLSTGVSEKQSRESLVHNRSHSSSRESGRSPSLRGRYSLSPSGGTGGGSRVRPVSRPSTRRGHVPYRNCMLTMVLKDSLSGNCLTAMIATISAEEINIHETISTCRFSQRVACISNRARRNEELDDKVVIRKLKKRVAELEAEIASMKASNQYPAAAHAPLLSQEERNLRPFSRSLSESDRQRCHQILNDFFHGKVDNPVTAGIDSAAMFQESLIVLRSIVLHSLGIGSQSLPNLAAAQSLSSQISQAKTSESIAASEENNSPPNKTHQTMKASPRNKMGHAFMTPSPNSRISSGFGSLRDEEGSINYESSYDHKNSQRKDHSDSQHPHNERDPNLVQIEQRSQEREKKRRRRHKHHRRRSHDAVSAERDPNHTAVHALVSPRNDQNVAADRVQRGQDNDPNPPPPKGAWEAPLTGLNNHSTTGSDQLRVQSIETSSDNQGPWQNPAHRNKISSQTDGSRSHVPIKIGTVGIEEPVRSPPPQAKVLSPRAEKQRQKLRSKQIELLNSREEKERLVNEVNLLNLKVLEEGIKDELSHTEEQLAVHHAQYTQLQRSGADTEHISAEKLAEQQLRIKQAKLHQKLMDVQYQLRMSGEGVMVKTGAIGHSMTPHPISSKHSVTQQMISSNMGSAAVSPPGTGDYWKMPSPQVQNEILKHEVQQSKIQQQIERLRISQMEKQLELKEASTRRKILALKLQLQSGNKPPTTAPEKRSMSTSATMSEAIPKSKSDQTMLSNNTRIDITSTSLSNSPQQTPPSRVVQSTFSTSEQETNRSRAVHTQHRPGGSDRTKVSAPVEISTLKTSPTPGTNRLIADSNIMMDPHIKNKQETKCHEKAANQESSPPAMSSPSTKTDIPSSRSHQKLTLPEEIKETEYISALQRQKARVSRIRRCIVAATVIQRAWRDYKKRN